MRDGQTQSVDYSLSLEFVDQQKYIHCYSLNKWFYILHFYFEHNQDININEKALEMLLG